MEGGNCKARINFGKWIGKVKREVGSGSGELGLNTGFDLGKWEVLSGKWGDMLGMNLGEREEGSEKLY